jgi:hypothetical protein
LEPKNCASQDPGPRFLDPLISRDKNLESKEAHRTTSKLTVFPLFSALFHREHARPFRVFLVGLRVGPRSKQQEEHKDWHAVFKPMMQNGYPQQWLGTTFQEHRRK